MKYLFLSILLFILLPVKALAQLCTGSLGDPVALYTFGAGPTGTGPALPAGVTTYLYVGDCPNDGFYTLTNFTFGCFGGSWGTLTGDHTPNDNGGYFMVVNASIEPGDFYLDTVRGLCGITTYEFSAWIANMMRIEACNNNGIKPNLTFSIETVTGAILTQYNTGDIPSSPSVRPDWKQYGTFFTTPVSVTSVVVRIKNNAPGGCGNDLALDDITFRPCGPAISAVEVNSGQSSFDRCEGDTSTLQLKGSYTAGYVSPVLQWQESKDLGRTWKDIPFATSSSYTVKPNPANGFYYFRLGIAESGNQGIAACRIYSKPVIMSYSPIPFAQVTNYVFGCYGQPIALFAAGGSTYEWTGPNSFYSTLQGPRIDSAQFTDEGRYYVTITSAQGCSDTASVYLLVSPAARATAGPDTYICEGSGTTLSASGGERYFWYPVEDLVNDTFANPIASPTETTLYTVVVTNQYQCKDTAFQKVNVWKKTQANAGPDQRTRKGIPVNLNASIGGTDVSFSWSPLTGMDDPSSLTPRINASVSGFYRLDVNSIHGCGKASDAVYVKVYDKITIPNAFSPNGDGINDTWAIEPLDLFFDAVLEVYNRYGQLVFRNVGLYNNSWKGTFNNKPLPVGTYYYLLDLKIAGEVPMKGTLTILR